MFLVPENNTTEKKIYPCFCVTFFNLDDLVYIQDWLRELAYPAGLAITIGPLGLILLLSV